MSAIRTMSSRLAEFANACTTWTQVVSAIIAVMRCTSMEMSAKTVQTIAVIVLSLMVNVRSVPTPTRFKMMDPVDVIHLQLIQDQLALN